jgi:heptosyltransferase-1
MKRILFTRMSSLGDIIHTFPAATDVLAAYPDATLDWIVEEAYVPLVRMHPGVSRIIPIALRRWRRQLLCRASWREMRAFREALRGRAYDAIIETQGLMKSAAVARLAAGPIYGFGRRTAREPHAARLYHVTYEFAPEDHKIERYRAVAARALGYAPGTLDYGIASPARPEVAPSQRYCVLLHSTARAGKLWVENHWRTLGCWLEGRGLICVLPWGSEGEHARSVRLAAVLCRPVVPPRMSLEEAGGLIGHAEVVVGLDTGLTHLAAALNVPVVGIFCDSEPLDAHPLGSGPIAYLGGVRTPPSAEAVIEAVKKIA